MQDFFLHYCLVKELATKTLRTTYLAYPLRETQKKVILKIFDKECANQDHEMSSVRLDALMSMDHPHIVPILDIALEQGKPYIVSEYRALGSLSKRSGRHKRGSQGYMDWLDAVRIMQQIGQALRYAHSHEIIHGNIKPENIFYYNDSEVQLTDFSLSPFIDVTKLGYKADLRTTKYMAPEQFVGKTEKASDQYALSCLVYELITGHAPFEAQSFSSMWGKHTNDYAAPLSSHVKIPMPIDAAILRALAKKSEDRYEDMDAFLQALENALSASTSKDAFAGDASIAALVLNVSDGVKKAPVTKPFGFTPFPEVIAKTNQAGADEVSNNAAAPDQDALIAIDPPSLSALKRLVEGKKSTSQPLAQTIVAADRTPVAPEGAVPVAPLVTELEQAINPLPSVDVEPEQATNPLPSVEVEPEQATNPLPGIGDGGYARPYGQLIQRAERATEDQNTRSPEPLRDNHVVPPMATPVVLQTKSGKRKRFVLWISAISVLLILIGVLIPYLVNASVSKQIQTVVKYPTSNTIQTTAHAMVTGPSSQPTTPATAHAQSTASALMVTPSAKQNVTPTSVVPALVPTPRSSHATAPAATATPLHGTGSIQINAGGGAVGSFVADEDYTNRAQVPARPSSTTVVNDAINTSGVVDPAPQSVYQSYRVGDCTYTIADVTPGASYTVRLHFAETYWTTVGQRTFNVFLNGQLTLSNFDIVAAAGGSDKAVVEQFVTKPLSNGTITIQFLTVHDNAQINGIELLAN